MTGSIPDTPAARSRRTIRHKLVFLMALLVAGISLFIYLFFPARLHEQAVAAIGAKAASITQMSAYTLGPALDFNNVDEVEEALQAALQFEDVVYAFVRTADGTPVASFVRDSSGAAVLVTVDPQNGVDSGGALYHRQHAIASRDQVLGTLYMGFSLVPLQETLARSRGLLALVSLLVFVVGLGATYSISVFITRPLGQIVQAADRIAQGDLTQRAAVRSDDEVGRLALSFNKMVDSLESAYEAVQTSEARFRAFIEHATDIVGLLDQEGGILYLSPSVEEVVGYAAEALTGQSVFAYVHADDQDPLQAGLYQGVLHPDTMLTAEVRWRHKDGSWRYLSCRGRSLLHHPGVESILLIARDITENKQFEQELVEAKEQAEEMVQLKDTFLANMSHEIRTPLTGILGYAQILAEEVGEAQRVLVEPITTCGQRLMSTLNSVLDLAQLETHSITLNQTPLDPTRIVKEVVDFLKPLAQPGLVVETLIPPKPVFANLDVDCLQRILNNLIGNAIKFTKKGYVRIEIDGDDRYAYLRVRDSGVGISQAFLPHVFDEFKQESTGLARSHEGNGLGLAITKQLTELMGGTIAVESIKGTGSVFTLAFPRVNAPIAACGLASVDQHQAAASPSGSRFVHAGDRPARSPDDGTRPHVLVVEDNLVSQEMIEHMLAPYYEVEAVGTSHEALEAARRARFDAVLMDINLGDGPDGVDTMRDLRTVPAYQQIPIIALTAYALPNDARWFLNQGFNDYLSKPFQMDRLLGMLAGHLPASGSRPVLRIS